MTGFAAPPDIAVELRTRAKPPGDCSDARLSAYLDFGVRSAWVVDPERQTVEVYEGGERRTYQGDEPVRCSIVPALNLRPATLFERA